MTRTVFFGKMGENRSKKGHLGPSGGSKMTVFDQKVVGESEAKSITFSKNRFFRPVFVIFDSFFSPMLIFFNFVGSVVGPFFLGSQNLHVFKPFLMKFK